MNELKFCPFCGSEKVELKQTGKQELTLKCKKCVMFYKQKTLHLDLDWLRKKMVEHWNKRANECVNCADGLLDENTRKDLRIMKAIAVLRDNENEGPVYKVNRALKILEGK